MKHVDSHKDATAPASSAVAEVSFTSACNGSEYADAERSLLGPPGVAAAHLDRTRGVAHLTYDRSVTNSGAARGAAPAARLPVRLSAASGVSGTGRPPSGGDERACGNGPRGDGARHGGAHRACRARRCDGRRHVPSFHCLDPALAPTGDLLSARSHRRLGSIGERLWQRLLGRPAPESGTLCRGDRA
jgi:hypothetical protein